MMHVSEEFIKGLPKAELHLHLEGTLEPGMMFRLAERNRIALKYSSEEEIRAAYQFTCLQDFLDIYYAGAAVLIREEDFYDLTKAYLTKAHSQGVRHAEMMFDPQTHTVRGVSMGCVVEGITSAMSDMKKETGMTSGLILSFLRHLSEEDAFKTLEQAHPYLDLFIAVGLDSSERNNPPGKFERVFRQAAGLGLRRVAHAGEEGPPENIWGAIELLKVSRIDHGNSCLQDADLVDTLVQDQIPLTMCPLSNLKLKVISSLRDHPLREVLDKGVLATVNSDDPAYFGGYINENFIAVADALSLTREDIVTLASNSFTASFLSEHDKCQLIKSVNQYNEEI